MAASVLGFVGGFVALFVAIDAATGGEGPQAWGIPFLVAFPVVLGLAAALMGAMQWLVIRRRIPGSVRWIPATAGGVLGASLIVFGLTSLVGEAETLIGSVFWGALHALLVGLVVGSLQWLAIRRVDPSRRWLAATVLALLAAGVAGDTVAWYADGGVGIIVIFVLWQALSAPSLHRLTATVPALDALAPAA